MNCKYCGGDVPLKAPNQTGRQALFCSKECRSSFYYAPKVSKPCDYCGTEFIVSARNKEKKFCTRKCMYDSKVKRNDPMTKSCDGCGSEFITRIKAQRFCSTDCRLDYRASQSSTEWRKKNPKKDVYVYDCDWCEEKIERLTPLGGVKRYHPECSRQAQSARNRIKTVKRQNATVKPSRVWVEMLVETDGSDCQICKEPIDLTLARTSRFGATIDHIIPLSKGGTDEIDNLQLAHWICNNQKSDKLIEGLNA
jgi:5-methylcytosine-specific restriction endonuclease McrA